MIHLFHPLVLALLAFLSGLLPALRYVPPAAPFVLTGALSAMVGLFLLPSNLDTRKRAGVWLLMFSFASAGTAAGALGAARAHSDCRFLIPGGAEVRAYGVLEAGSGLRAGGGSAPLLPLGEALVSWADGSCRERVRVRLPAEMEGAPAGSRLTLAGVWVQPPATDMPTGWPRRGVFGGFVAVDDVQVSDAHRGLANPLLYMRGSMEERIRRLFPEHDAMAEALFLGRRERMDPTVREQFVKAGLVHLLAISGTHVGLLAGVVLIAGAIFRLPRRRLTSITLCLTWAYLAMIGAPASAVRAGLMLSLALLALLLQRPSAALPMIAAAGLVLLALDPLAILDPGFQLSFAGVGGILLVHHTLNPLIPAGWKRQRAIRWGLESVIVSAAAFVATAPITAHHFGAIAPIAVVANLPALPLMSLALVGVLAATTLSPILPPLARLCADGTGLAFDLLAAVAGFAASLPLGHLEVQRPQWSLWIAAAIAAALAARSVPHLRRPIRIAFATGVVASLLIVWPLMPRGSSDALELHFLDVGQGDATAIRTPRGRWVLIDAGPSDRGYDAGARRVLPFLRARGARTVDLLLLTHPHLDHIGGAPAILRGLPVANVMEPGLAVGSTAYLDLLQAVEETGSRWLAGRSGRSITVDGVRFDLLWPDEQALDGVSDANQISLVVRVHYGEFTALLTGDAGEEVERLLVARHSGSLGSHILKAGHHGSSTSSSAEFLAAVRPEMVIVSAGRRNRYGHPAPSVLRRLEDVGILLARTDQEGAVSIRVRRGDSTRWTRIQR
ncbi:hypothetical protein BH23GEM6_BH23GEM6_05640 [soil metagenome]